jgi:hypothetical protein
MGYEAQARHTYSQIDEVQGMDQHTRGVTRVHSEFLRNLLPSANMGTSQANDHIGLAKQLTHHILRFYVGLSTGTY